MKISLKCILTVLLVMLPSIAAAQSPEALTQRGEQAGLDRELLESLEERASRAGLDVAETARLMEPAVALAEQGLPAQAVVQRALEGLAKNVPPERIYSVLSTLEAATVQAGQKSNAWFERSDVQSMLGVESNGPDARTRNAFVESVAGALAREAPERALDAALERIPAEVEPGRTSASSVGAAIQILPDLPTTRQDPELSAGLLAQALNNGFSSSDLRQLPAALETASQRGEMPAESVARGVVSGMADGTPASTLLEGLFQGHIPGQPPGGAAPGLDRRPDAGPPGGN